jgi:predicted TIM-barrel fold metal-dependent hydrolase
MEKNDKAVPLSFFDCNCMIGKRSDRREGEEWSLESLLQDMQYYGIGESLVSYAVSKDYDPILGNHELMSVISGHHNLYPVWAIVPPNTPEIPSAKDFVRESQRHNIKAFTGFPKLHNFSLMDWCMGDLWGEIQKAGIPLLLPFSETNWDEIHSISTSFSKLPIIVQTVNYRQLRYLFPLWKKHRNIYVDISWFSIVDIIPFLEQHNMLDRLLFGTNYPVYTPGAAITMVTYANINVKLKQMVAGDTLRRLIQHTIQR